MLLTDQGFYIKLEMLFGSVLSEIRGLFKGNTLANIFTSKRPPNALPAAQSMASCPKVTEERETIYSNNGVTAYGWGR
jgi:hypothetical protein